MKEIKFLKAEAAGNDFIIIDKSNSLNGKQISRLAKELCQRRLSVGADGLLLIEPSKSCDLKMRVFNPDGSEVQMCGNGIRCVALYAARAGICSKKMAIETKAGNLSAEVKKDRVKVNISEPKDLRLNFYLDIEGNRQDINYINTGVPHVVCFVQGLDRFSVDQIGRCIRYHSEFQPQGTNANFVEVLDENHIRLRTYERGVEQETLACGTGAVAASIVSVYQGGEPESRQYKIQVKTKGGKDLFVYFRIKKDKIDQVYLEGKARLVYQGSIEKGAEDV